jgi:hypothetical protein
VNVLMWLIKSKTFAYSLILFSNAKSATTVCVVVF